MAVAAVAVGIDVDVADAVGNKARPMRKVWLRRCCCRCCGDCCRCCCSVDGADAVAH